MDDQIPLIFLTKLETHSNKKYSHTLTFSSQQRSKANEQGNKNMPPTQKKIEQEFPCNWYHAERTRMPTWTSVKQYVDPYPTGGVNIAL